MRVYVNRIANKNSLLFKATITLSTVLFGRIENALVQPELFFSIEQQHTLLKRVRILLFKIIKKMK